MCLHRDAAAAAGLHQSSISLGTGFRVCRIVVPGSDGLNGASAPYGFGMPTMSSGMYAFGRGSAVVCVS